MFHDDMIMYAIINDQESVIAMITRLSPCHHFMTPTWWTTLTAQRRDPLLGSDHARTSPEPGNKITLKVVNFSLLFGILETRR